MKGLLIVAGVLAPALLAGGVVVGCGSAFSAASGTDGGNQGDGTTTDAAVDGLADGQSTGDGSTVDGATGAIVYVSPNGKDTNSGLDPTQPKKTIGGGLLVAGTLPGVPTVEVCAEPASAGNAPYSEGLLAVAKDVELLGGWDCTFQTRSPAAYPTVVNNGAAGSQSATLLVTPAANAITSKTVIDGLTINGGTASQISYGVNVTGNASPVLSNDVVTGGGGTATGADQWGSVGVRVADGAMPEITNCLVEGGNGTGPSGSAGIVVELSGNANIHNDIVTGGSGSATSGVASTGIVLTSATQLANPVVGVLVYGNDYAMSTSTGAPASGVTDGILVENGVSGGIQDSVVQGGTSTVGSRGVDVHNAGTVLLAADRIYGGSGGSKSTGVLVSQTSGTFTLVNSEVHAGSPGTSTSGGSSVGVDLSGTAAPVVVDDTIYAGANTGTAIALDGVAPDGGTTAVTNAFLRDDLLLGSGGSNSSGVVATVAALSGDTCKGIIANLDYSAFTNFSSLFTCVGLTDNTAANLAGLQSGSCPMYTMTCTDNVQIGDAEGESCSVPGCIADSSCPGSPAACLGSIFGSWANDGTGIFSPPAVDGGSYGDWAVLATFGPVACGGIGQSGITTDLLGAPRTTTGSTTIGAVVTAAPAPDGGLLCPQ